MKFITGLLIATAIISCKSKNTIDELQYYKVRKTKFVNSINVSGTLESSNIISYNCPLRQYDLTINYLATEGIIVHKGDTICQLVCAELDNFHFEATKNYELAASELEKIKAQQQLETKILESQVKSIETSTSISMLDSSRLDFYTPARRKISELNLEKAQIEIGKYRRKIDYMKRINDAVISKLQLRIKQEENKVKRYSDEIKKLTMLADTSGILAYAFNRNSGNKIKIGDIVWGIRPIVSIINVSSLQIKLLVSEAHFKLIQKDQPLEIRIDAGDTILYKGKIISKSPGGKPPPGMWDSKVKFFEVFTTIEPLPKNIQPGVSVSCKVYINEYNDTIAIPIMSVFEKDSNKIVYLLEATKCRKKIVKTGPSSEKEIIIIQGLKPNDKIALKEPPESLLH